MPRPASADPRLSAAAYSGMFVFGIVMALLGAIMPVLSDRMAFDMSDAGTLFLVMNAAMLASSLALGLVMDRFGLKVPLALGGWLVAGALVSIAMASTWLALLPAVFALGLGGGALNGGTNTLVADLHSQPQSKASALNLLGVFFGIGALLLPFSLGATIARVGLAGVLLGAAALCAASGAFAAALRFPAPKAAHRPPAAEMLRLCREPLVIVLAVLLFFQSGNEFMLGGYFATFLTRDLVVPVDRAAYILTAFWAAIVSSRLALSRALLTFRGHHIVLGGAILAAIGALIVSGSSTSTGALAGIVVTGAALAGIFPIVLSQAGAVYHLQSGTVFGILFTAALTGGMTMPWIAGNLAETAGLRAVFVLVTANFAAIALLTLLAGRVRPADAPVGAR